eukprot:CAMPEP_0194527492 /NCGR_PEP_ID=MMETSP0253-20130528/63617_1 /TAXON_ID=2966 /ORGANISM="Noctiluca scintillans" /LENGTH=142 /DNA_ID=CAMNT_0039372437 /DNA_START=381 /DNA_END=807 /DNA_ORIENTATION=+
MLIGYPRRLTSRNRRRIGDMPPPKPDGAKEGRVSQVEKFENLWKILICLAASCPVTQPHVGTSNIGYVMGISELRFQIAQNFQELTRSPSLIDGRVVERIPFQWSEPLRDVAWTQRGILRVFGETVYLGAGIWDARQSTPEP